MLILQAKQIPLGGQIASTGVYQEFLTVGMKYGLIC
jgi:hypothetical protein